MSEFIKNVTLETLSDIIMEHAEEYGWGVEDAEEGEEVESLDWQLTEDLVVEVSLEDSDGIKLVKASIALEDDAATLEDINNFNAGQSLVSAFMMRDEETNSDIIIVRGTLPYVEGVSRDSLCGFLELFSEGLADLLEEEG